MKNTIKTYPVMLPTESNTYLWTDKLGLSSSHSLNRYANEIYMKYVGDKLQHLYLVSDREIRVGDFYYNEHQSHTGMIYKRTTKDSVMYDGTNRKVEASTKLLSISEDLVNISLPTIPVNVIKDWIMIYNSKSTPKVVYLQSYTDCPNCEMCDSAMWNKDCDTCKGEGLTYLKTTRDKEVKVAYPTIENKEAVGKFIIVKDLNFSDFMKDDNGNIATYDSRDDALLTCGMYEFPNALVLKVEYNHIEQD